MKLNIKTAQARLFVKDFQVSCQIEMDYRDMIA